MNILIQLKLLLWKNFLLRKRQKLRCIKEFFWPLCLFLLLAWIRTKGFIETKHECHYEDKPLPSAGTLLYYQGLICTLNNTCNEFYHNTYRNYSELNSSRFYSFYDELNTFVQESNPWNKNVFVEFSKEVQELVDKIEMFGSLQNSNILLSFITNDYLEKQLGYIITLHENLETQTKNIGKILMLINILQSIDKSTKGNNKSFDKSNTMDDTFQKLHTFLCGNHSVPVTLSLILNQKRHKSRLANFLLQSEYVTPEKYNYDPNFSYVCNKIYEELQTKKSLHLFWRKIKPFARGKVIFSPNTTKIKRIIDKVKETMTVTDLPNFEFDDYALEMNPELYNKTANNLMFMKNFTSNIDYKGDKVKIISLMKHNMQKTIDDAQLYLENLHILYQLLQKLKKVIFPSQRVSATEILKCYTSLAFEGYNTEEEAERRSSALIETNDFLAQISFLNIDNSSGLKPLTSYKIRMNMEKSIGSNEMFLTNGFVYIQDILEKSIITELTGRTDLPGFILKQFPYPCHIKNMFMTSLVDLFPLFMVLSWVYTTSMIIKNIVHEKEAKIKETMHILGLNNCIYWCSWFIDSFIPMTITIFLLSIILVHGKIITNAEISLVLVFLLCYTLATIPQCFLISVFFSNANIATTSGGIIFFMTYLAFPVLEFWKYYIPKEARIFFFILSNVAFGEGAKVFAEWELEGSGANWKNWDRSPSDRTVSLKIVLQMLSFDSLIYFFLTWYLEGVYPGNIGLPKPWYFPFDRHYWFPTIRYHNSGHAPKKIQPGSYVNEPEPIHLRKGVEIYNLSKVYKNGKLAISNLTINFYENQITAFLGRNGAGKTTTISILTGLFPPTSGTAKINGWDIGHNMQKIRKSLGVCPQSNVHFRHFTVEEHLWFFARLKGTNPAQVQIEIQQILADLNMTEKKDSLIAHLSGGMKRKLSIAMAFIGKSRTVILDEPTAGIDPYSRQGIWNLLLKYKKGRTIVMTTHNMWEAELLGDRIAIFANGQIQCFGSAMFLKSKFGWGHILTLDLMEHDKEKGNHQVKGIIEIIQKVFPAAVEIERFGTEIKYGLPKIVGNINNYQILFKSLDSTKKLLGIRSYGITDTNLEEIFLKIVDRDDDVGEKLEDIKNFEDEEDGSGFSISNLKLQKNRHYFRQFKALFIKRYKHSQKNIIGVLMQLLLPVVFVFLCFCVTYKVPPIEQPKPILVDNTNCGNCQTGFFEILPSAKSWTSKYVEQFNSLTGIGVKCLKINGIRDRSCSIPRKVEGKHIYTDLECKCSDGIYKCPPCSQYDIPEKIILSSGYEMLNITGKNISNWILDSWHCYKQKRLGGGYSLGFDISKQDRIFSKYQIKPKYVNIETNISSKEIVETNKTLVNDNIKIWFNPKWSMAPISYLNSMNNLILRASLPANISDNFGIKLYIHPMNYTKKQYEYEYRLLESEKALLHAVSLIFALSIIPASFVMYLIEERVSGAKHLQFISGLNWIVYWVQSFIWDMLCYCFAIGSCLLSLVIFQANAYIDPISLPGFISVLLLYGWAAIPLMYPASFYFDVPSSAFVSLSCINIFFGVTTTASTYLLRVFNDEYLGEIEQILRNVLVIFPHFCLGEGILKIIESHTINTTLASYNINYKNNLYSFDALGKNNLSMFLCGIVFFIFVLIFEKYQNRGTLSEHKVCIIPPIINDEDVLNERTRILNNDLDDVLVLKSLTKVYPVNNHIAVNQLCLGIKSKECFGLLGLNGAGKSTTFKMLTGDLSITFGDAFILGHSLRNKISSVRNHIGYCPQNDALDRLLTSKEHLELYCDLRNIPYEKKELVVDTYLKKFDLVKYRNISVIHLTGGNKRKLSTALAILGNTHIILLDEPTSGMDPKGQRFLWSTIKNCIRSGRSVILTSHSMNECESLCSRITVMVNGQFKCLGSTQHLKNKYGRGYNFMVRVKQTNIEEVKQRLFIFPKMKERHTFSSQISFEVDEDILSLMKVFEVLEKLIGDSMIEDYSFSQKSLEEIFLHFVQVHMDSSDNV